MRDITLEDTFQHDFTTRQFSDGVPTLLAGSPVLSVLEGNNATPITAGVSVSVSRASVVGLNEATVVATAANGYEAGKSYSIYISAGTVGGVSVIGEVVGAFTVAASAAAVDLANSTDGLGAIKTDTASIIDLVNGLGGSTGGSVSIQTLLDNTLTGVSINNGGAAVDKGTSPPTVGIPVTDHAFVAGQQVTLANTASNDGSFDVDSVSVNEVVILKTFAAETFGADDTISSTVKTVGFVGSVQAGTVVSTEALDGTLHDIDASGSDIDIVYTFNVGAGRTGTEIIFHGFVQTNNDAMDIEVWDHVGEDWEVLRTIAGINGTTVSTQEVALLLKHTGTTGLDTGRVYVRFDLNVAPTNLSIDQLLVEAINTGALSAYENGQIWINTNASNTNTVADVDGTSRRPVSTIAAAKTLSTSTGLSDFHVINGSSITLAENTDNESYFGDNWTLALNGQSCAGAHFQGSTASGVQTGSGADFSGGEVKTVTLADDVHVDSAGLDGTITLPAGTVQFENCHNTGTTNPVFDYGDAVGSTTVHCHGYGGHIEVQNMGDSGTDALHLTGHGELVVNANCVGGTIDIQGVWEITDSSGNVTITKDDITTEVTAVKVTTDKFAFTVANQVDANTLQIESADATDTLLAAANAALDTAISELSQGIPTATPTMRTALMLMYMALRNKLDVATSGTDTLEVHSDDGTRIAQKLLTDDGSDYSEAKMSSGA